ncbi:hypothetical protein ACJX0J_025053, partial [Zea mays]
MTIRNIFTLEYIIYLRFNNIPETNNLKVQRMTLRQSIWRLNLGAGSPTERMGDRSSIDMHWLVLAVDERAWFQNLHNRAKLLNYSKILAETEGEKKRSKMERQLLVLCIISSSINL